MAKSNIPCKKAVSLALAMAILAGNVAFADIADTYLGEPYYGAPFVIGEMQTTIKLCDFDKGQSGIVYRETDGNTTSYYRPGEVDCYDFGQGITVVGGMNTGEWLNYSINVEKSGYYDFNIGSTWSYLVEPSGTIHFEIDGKDVTGPVKISENTDLAAITRQIISSIYIKKGSHILKLVVDQKNGMVDTLIITPSIHQIDEILKSIKLNKGNTQLEIGETEVLKIVTEPKNADVSDVTWESDNEGVASVDENGKVTAKSCGIASIKAILGGREAYCKIKVNPVSEKETYKTNVLVDELTIPCIDYNRGGEGIAYHKSNESKKSSYRGESVNIEGENDNLYVCDTSIDDWLKYTIDVETDNYFNIGVLSNTETDKGKFTLMLDGEIIIDGAKVPKGKKWNDFGLVDVKDISVTKGRHTLKLIINEEGAMYKALTFKKARALDELVFDENYKGTPYNGDMISIGIGETVIPLWKYDEGGSEIAYNQKKNKKGIMNVSYRAEEDVYLYDYDDGNYSISNVNENEWLCYTVNIDKSGYYDVSITTSWTDEWNPVGSMHLELDGVPITDVTQMPVTGNWNKWTNANLGNLYLPSGKHLLKIVFDKSGSNYTYLNFALNSDTEITRGDFATAALKNMIKPVEFKENFIDVLENESYYDAVGTLKELGIVKGSGDNLFKPEDPVTKEEALYIISEVLEYTGRMIKKTGSKKLEEYSDYAELTWSAEALRKLANAGLVLGGRNKISKDMHLSAAEATTYIEFMNKCIGLIKKVPEIEPIYLADEFSPAYDWIKEEFLRGMYCFVSDLDITDGVDKVKDYGMNTVIIHMFMREHETPDGYKKFVSRCKELQDRLDVKLFISLGYGADEYYGNTQFGKFSTGGANKWVRTPCPLSEGYWNAVIGDRMVEAARQGVTGAVADMEMYGADQTRLPGSCYCDDCWSRFLLEFTTVENPLGILDENRSATLAASGLSFEYARWQEIEVSKILRKIEQKVHAVNPDFLIGNLLDMESLPGLSRGFGTPEKPSLIFSETEYSGAISGLDGRINQLRNSGYPSIYVPGFWPNPLTPNDLEEKIVQAAPKDKGYWMWSIGCFAREDMGIFYQQNENYTKQEYINAVDRANKKLDEAIRTGEFEEVSEDIAAPTYTAARIEGSPTETDWDKVSFTEDFKFYNIFGNPEVLSRAKILWNGEKLFVRVYNDEPQMSELAPSSTDRDNPNIWMEDCNEVFWKFQDSTSYVHYVAAREGNFADYYGNGYGNDDISLNFDAVITPFTTDSGWGLDMELPLTIDGERTAQSGEIISVEICRYRPLNAETSCWAPTFGVYRGSPNLWGKVTLE